MNDRRVALVTGATRGIGAAIARTLADDHHVLIGGTRRADTEAVAVSLPSAQSFAVDLTDEAATADAVREIDRLDVLVHSAGVATYGSVADTDRATWRHTFEVNVVAVAHLTALLLPRLRRESGLVIVVNSGSGHTSHPNASAYCASKFAARALTEALREEERGSVRVCSIHPGRVDTDMQRDLQVQLGNDAADYDGSRFVSADAVAATVRLAVDTPSDAVIDELTIRSAGR